MAGGDAPTPGDVADLPPFEHVIAADSGLDHALAVGLSVDLVIGDLDSVSEVGLAAARDAGVTIEQHPSDKDRSDLELAIDAAVARGVASVIVLAAGGGRLDHQFGNLLLLASPRYAGIDLEARWDGNRAATVRSRARTFRGRPGDVITLEAVHGPAHRVRTEGLRWPLEGETLEPGSTRGVSNELAAEWAWVVVGEGVVLAVQPASRTT